MHSLPGGYGRKSVDLIPLSPLDAVRDELLVYLSTINFPGKQSNAPYRYLT